MQLQGAQVAFLRDQCGVLQSLHGSACSQDHLCCGATLQFGGEKNDDSPNYKPSSKLPLKKPKPKLSLTLPHRGKTG